MNAISHAGLSDVGRMRTANEDRWFADPDLGLYLVADGIGGSANGGLAAQIVAEVLPRLLRRKLEALSRPAHPPTQAPRASEGQKPIPPRSRAGLVSTELSPQPQTRTQSAPENPAASEASMQVSAVLVELSEQLRKESQATPGLKGIGSTVVLALVRNGQGIVAHLGDSRAYLLRSGRLEQLTTDHTIAQLLVDRGELTPDEAAAHPGRAQLTRFVGMATEAIPETQNIDLSSGDWLLLCSDGLSGMLSDRQIQSILNQQTLPADACRDLIAAANQAGGKDNVTAVIVAMGDDVG